MTTVSSPGGLRKRSWKRFLRGPDQELLEELYVPALSEAVRYDRCCSYFSSSVLAAAARGFGRLIERLEAMGGSATRPAVRLIVNEELTADDVRAMTETGNISRLEEALEKRFKTPRDMLKNLKPRLAMLGWLVNKGLLEVRVGVMRRGEGILHAKFGIMSDENGDAVAFSGSGNESARGILANYERLEVSTSWEDPERHREYGSEFDTLWRDGHPDVHTVTLPEALRLKLVKLAPREPPIIEPSGSMARQKAAMLWRFIVEAPYLPNGETACDATAMVDLWPHQRRVVEETAEAWPEGRLLCDEVGMGKTVEAILVLRRLMAGRGVRRALILLPAGLLRQWQAELREKGGMIFPRLEGTSNLVWPDEKEERVSGLAEALERDVLLMSRETARTENNLALLLAAPAWDLVVLDESHAARRRKQEEGEFNRGTLLLTLLRQLQLRRRARGFLLLSATPMQTHPWEPWDLLAVLGEGGAWLAEFEKVRNFYNAIPAVKNGRCDMKTAQRAAALIAADPCFPPFTGEKTSSPDAENAAKLLSFARPTQREELAQWLRRGSPLGRRIHRNTKATLREYHARGMLGKSPPERKVDDIVFNFQDPAERLVYNEITRYIERRFAELEKEKPGKGFVMTIYRRRASSSPLALERSLNRRREGLLRVVEARATDTILSLDEPESVDPDEFPDTETGARVSPAFPTDPKLARGELQDIERLIEQRLGLGGRDTKRDKFFEVLRKITEDGRAVLVFTEYTDTLEYLRDSLVDHYGTGLGCFSGIGGQQWDGSSWKPVTKDVITRSLQGGELRVLLCTDAASEGLNLQTAGAVINYDLPWNPSKVEQRIGRIDRIGQKLSTVHVVNLFLENSVDDKVYRALRSRCGLFEHFVGPMQPVLARARRMLLGQEKVELNALEKEATQVEQDPLALETYVESLVTSPPISHIPASREKVENGLASLVRELGFHVKKIAGSSAYRISGLGRRPSVFASTVEALEQNPDALPLSPLEPHLAKIAERLSRSGECLPFVVGSWQSGAFRRSISYWMGEGETYEIKSFDDLEKHLQKWDGSYADPEKRLREEQSAQRKAERQVRELEARTDQRERQGLERQVAAARIRLQIELGRYLVCIGAGAADLNKLLHTQMKRDIASSNRLKRCIVRLGGYPKWPPDLCQELESFVSGLSDNQRKARLLGKEIDAALEDPRWEAM